MQLSQTPMIEMKVVPIERPYAQTQILKIRSLKEFEPEYGPGHTSNTFSLG